jgi:phosphoribosylamine-glycine ligase
VKQIEPNGVAAETLVSAGSRTLAVVSRGPSLAAAEPLCESALRNIHGPFFYRSDIGTAALISRRVDHMNSLRNSQASAARSA